MTVKLRDVSHRFGAEWALTGLNLDLGPGVTGLLGPNGAGKTTLLRLFATALAPTRRETTAVQDILSWTGFSEVLFLVEAPPYGKH